MQSQRTHTHIPAREPPAPWHKAEPRTVSVVSHQAPSLESWGWGPQKVFGSVGSRWLKSLPPASRHDADPVPYQDWHRTPASMNSDGAKWPPCPWASRLSIRLQHPCFPLSSAGSPHLHESSGARSGHSQSSRALKAAGDVLTPGKDGCCSRDTLGFCPDAFQGLRPALPTPPPANDL